LIDLLEPGTVHRRGQKQGVEGCNALPPATNDTFEGEIETQQPFKQCVMHENHSHLSDRCENPVVNGSDFCAEHIGVKLCKTSGIQYLYEGNSDICMISTVPAHPVDTNYLWGGPPRTKRAVYCGDRNNSRCRNLWRDTQPRRERQVEVAKIENGERSERYALISNYCNSGQKVVVNKQTNRVVS
jgi:hypothetical protein